MHGTGNNERHDAGRQAAGDRGQGEERHTGGVDARAPQVVAQRAADEDQGREKERVGFDDPL
jgi:hypothetical protein